jgi:hypothetical protein
MPSPTDFNLSPYFDDFSETKKFHRVLFRPAFAVQARELTQSQTILQNQIERVSDHLFEKGAMIIPGEIGYDLYYYAIKLTSKSASNVSDYVGSTLTGATSGVTATVINAVATDGTDPDTLFVKYIKTATTDNSQINFTHGETINSNAAGTPSAVVASCHTGSAAEVQEGIYYINGFHVEVNNQTLILDKYTNTPSYRVGLTVTESFETSNDDTSLNDNAAGSSNVNAPGAHRFKILLTLAKKTISSTEDSNFYELMRLNNGNLQNKVRTTEYAVLEDTLARRTFDESGDYTVSRFDIDIREHLISGTNRGIFTSSNGGLESKLAIGLSPGKAYVKGYEIEKIATTFVDVDKARDFETQQNFGTRFDIGNFVNVTNVFNTPDITFDASSSTEAFKKVSLHSKATSARGTIGSGSGTASLDEIGRAKTRGFEYSSGIASNFTFSSSSLTSAIYKHYLFDITMFTHVNSVKGTAFTTGETITGSTSAATATVESISAETSKTISAISNTDNPGITSTVSSTAHGLEEGQQITVASAGWNVDSSSINDNTIFTVRNPSANAFDLFDADGTSAVNVTSYSSGGTIKHAVVVLSNVRGEFVAGETITGGTSSGTDVIQSNVVGFKAVRSFDMSNAKQISMAGSPTYTADTSLATATGEVTTITGSLDIAATANSQVTGSGTRFTTELEIGDSITFTNNNGTSETHIVEAIVSDTQITLESTPAAASTKTIATRNRSKLQSPEKNISVFSLPYETIKTLKTTSNGGVTDTNYKFSKQFTSQLSNGSLQLTAGNNEVFTALTEGDYVISIKTLGSASTGAAGDVLSITGNNANGSAIFSRSGSPTGKILTLNFGTAYADATLKVVATISKSIGDSKSKALQENSTLAVATQATIESGTINLGKADIFQLKSIKMAADFSTNAQSSDTDITDRFDLDNGQRDNFYDVGRIKLKTGALNPTGRLLITFDFFTHGAGDYFDVDSYEGVVTYENIPSYTSVNSGERFELRDSLDFRPRVADDSTINSGSQDRDYDTTAGATVTNVIKFNTDVAGDFEYYLPRIDKVFLDKNGSFKILKGASALSPQVPGTLDNAMHLYTLFLPSYTLDTAEIGIESVDNKRYTMRDIGRIEKRIENTEYYTQLSMLEQNAQSLQIQDADGFDRFKNGFIVDNFTGHGIGDVGNNDYKASIDYAEGQLRPSFHEDAIQLIERDDDGSAIVAADRTDSNYAKTGDLITLPFTESTLIDQPYASKSINVNPFGVFTWIGSIDLTPPSDEWKETERAPELVINNPNGSWDNLVKNNGNSGQLSEFPMSTVWNEWQDTWTGRPVETERRNLGTYEKRGGHGWRVIAREEVTTSQRVQQARTGIRAVAVPETVRTSMGDKIISVAFVPFIRSKTLTFSATRMKPNTRVYAYFDNILITSYVTPTGGSLGGNLITDTNGAISGTFTIPDPKNNANPRWRTGKRLFRLTSSASNSQTNSDVDTAANAEYTASGTINTVQETIVSSREFKVEMRSVTDTQTINRTSTRTEERQVGYHDPLAQTFLIDDAGGVFLSSVDLHFSSKDSAIPVTVQIRDVVNGYPGQKILPFSEVTLNPSSVNTSSDSSSATTFNFPSPVYIQENVEYCFVIMSNCQNYNAYVARMGETNLLSDRSISSQPYAGVMFKSQNGTTWSAEQNEDIKFKLKRCEFENVTGTVTLVNDTLPSRTLKTNPLRTTSGSAVIRVFHPNHGMHTTSNNVTISGMPSGTTHNIPAAEINKTHTSISNITLDSYDITVSTNANTTGDMGSAAIIATQNRHYDVLNLSGVQTMQVPGTTINHYVRPTSSTSVSGSETSFALTSGTNKIAVVGNDNISFTSPKMVASEINETNEITGSSKSFFTVLELATANTKLSPVIDTQRMSAFVISNRLNSPQSGDPDYVSDITNTGTSSAAVYCTKPIILENTSTALDVRLTANVRGSSEIEMYYRVTGPQDESSVKDLSWIPFNTNGNSDVAVAPATNDSTFNELRYTASSINEFTTFQLKIVMKGTNSSYPPIISDMRGIALAV